MDILQQIIDMDKKAAAEVETARTEELRRLQNDDERNQHRLEQAVANEQAQAKEFLMSREEKLKSKKGKTEARLKEQTDKLDEVFNSHRQQWQAEIISRITGEQ